MQESITVLGLGIVCVLIGISNMKGNISSLHSYHRNRVSEEDKPIFGKKVGLGTIICGGALILYGVFSAITHFTENQIFTKVGAVSVVAGLAAGLGVSLYAILKYNKSLFGFK